MNNHDRLTNYLNLTISKTQGLPLDKILKSIRTEFGVSSIQHFAKAPEDFPIIFINHLDGATTLLVLSSPQQNTLGAYEILSEAQQTTLLAILNNPKHFRAFQKDPSGALTALSALETYLELTQLKSPAQ